MSCPDCFRGAANPGTPKGTTSPLHGVQTYIALPPPSPTAPKNSALILYTDAFGHLLPNNLLLADALAAALNVPVYVPDIIPGGAMSPSILPLMDTFSSPASGWFAKSLALARAMVHVVPFFARASPQSEACTTPCVEFARAVKREIPDGGTLGLVGYCWGGYQALRIAGLAHGGAEGGKVADAVFVAHPARFEGGQVVSALEMGVKVSFAHAGDDMSLKIEKVEELRRMVEGRDGVEIRVYEGCVHGFAVRATPGKEREGKAAEEALSQAVVWLGKWL